MRTRRWAVVVVTTAALFAASCDGSGGGGDDAGSTTGNEGEMVTVAGTIDQFSRPDDPSSLGIMPGGPVWFNESGTWGVTSDQAYLSEPGPDRSHAVIDTGQSNHVVQVRLPTLVNGAGLVFRYRSPLDYWAVVAVPGYATWAVIKVADGNEQVVADTGLSPVADGTAVGVRTEGPAIDVILEQRVVRTITDDHLIDADKVGLTAQQLPGVDPGAARFDEFRVALPEGSRLPTPPEPAPLGDSGAGGGVNG